MASLMLMVNGKGAQIEHVDDSIRPGALFVPGADVDVRQLVQAQQLGAYGAIVPHAMRGPSYGYVCRHAGPAHQGNSGSYL